jgi:hypothetical protein
MEVITHLIPCITVQLLEFVPTKARNFLITQWKISINTSDLESGIKATLVSLLSVNISKKPNKHFGKNKLKLKQSENYGTRNSMFRVCLFIFTAIF